jgi:hypothetical protein
MNNIWIFKDGLNRIECTSFPYAFRTMHATIRRNVEKLGQNRQEVTKKMSIVSPLKDRNGKNKIYPYEDAVQMAKSQGLIDTEGKLNSREFRR